MKQQKFKGELLGGHKDAAVEVPFDPEELWSIPASRLRPGRWGHHVEGRLNKMKFNGVVVPRSRKFWLVIDGDLQQAADLSVGDVVEVSIGPRRM